MKILIFQNMSKNQPQNLTK